MWSRKPSTLDVSYLNLRLCIGVLGVALPFILRIGSSIFPPDPYSVSADFHAAYLASLLAELEVKATAVPPGDGGVGGEGGLAEDG